jgi:hypothetical protein
MSRNSAVIDQSGDSAVIYQSGERAPADETLEATGSQQATAVGLSSSSPSNEARSSDQTAPTNTASGSVLGSDTNVPSTPAIPTFPFVPPPPPFPISNSNILPTTHPAGSSIPLIPVRRTSQGPSPAPAQPQLSSGTSSALQSNGVASATTPRASLYLPRQESHGSTAPTSYIRGPMASSSYPNQPYQFASSSAPPIFASPAPMPSYGFLAPTPYQSPASYPAGVLVPPRSQHPSTSPAQTPYSSYGTPLVAYPGQPIPPRSQHPETASALFAPQTPALQSGTGSLAYPSVPQQTMVLSAPQTRPMYRTSPAYGGTPPHPSFARPQSYGDPLTAGSPPLPYSNIPQQPVIPPIIPDIRKTPGRRRTDTFVANDPFRPHPHSRNKKPSDDLTFDDIPVPGAAAVSLPWLKYDGSSSEISTSQYPDAYNQSPWNFYAPPAPYSPISGGQQNQGQPPSIPSWLTNPPWMYPGNSQYPPPSQPFYNRPSYPSTFLPSPMYTDNPYYPPSYSGMYVIPTPKKSIWSRVGDVFCWPFSRWRDPNLPYPFIPYPSSYSSSEESKSEYPSLVFEFIVNTMPREVYYYFLLRLPSLYLSRVARIFEDADLSLPRLKEMALATTSQGKNVRFDIQDFESDNVPPEYERLKSTWEAFIDSVTREWKTFNIISVLLLSCVLLPLGLLFADLKLTS